MKRLTLTWAAAGLLALTASTVNAQEHVWKYVATGDATTYAIRDDGTLWSCGWNEKGQLGVPTVSERTATFQCVGTDSDWAKVVGGKAYAFFIKEDGTLWAVGSETDGVQGTGDGIAHREPVQVGTDNDWTDVAVSHFWGYTAIGLKADGTMWGWGNNSSGQLGTGGGTASLITPTKLNEDSDWVMVTIGSSHTLALKSDGTMWSWGANFSGQLAHGDLEGRETPTQVGTDSDWAYVKAIDNRSYAVKTDGTLWAAGDNSNNLLGFDQATEELVSAYPEFTQVTTIPNGVVTVSGCENTTTFAVGEPGAITAIYALGSNTDGALGDGNGKLLTATSSSSEMPFSSTPVQPLLPEGLTYSMLSSGQGYSMVLTTDGVLYGWGRNKGGQIGDDTELEQLQTSYYKKPIEIACPGGATPDPGDDDEEAVVVDATDVPTNLNDAKAIKLTGTWNTESFTELAQALGVTGFGASNSNLTSVDMSEALIEATTDLYVQGGFSKNGAFVNCKALETVIMPAEEQAANFADLTNAFMNCESLAEIDLQFCSGLTSLNSAFMNCTSLTEVNLSSSTGLTGFSSMDSTFDGCTALTKVTLPAEIAFASSTFGGCTALTDIDWTSYAGTEAPVFYADMFEGISDLKAITLTVAEDMLELFTSDANWSKLNVVADSPDGISSAEQAPALSFDGDAFYAAQAVQNVQVYTASGSLVESQSTVEGYWRVAGLQDGIYIVVYTQDGKTRALKVAKY